MLTLRRFWDQHKKKILVTLGVVGGGYCVYKLYTDYQHRRLTDLEKQLDGHISVDELIKAQLQSHFENIQTISDNTTLPSAMPSLRNWMMEEWDCAELIERLGRLKGHASLKEEKAKLYNDLKVMSFTRTVSSLWAMTMLTLYAKVQVTILGRHLYLDFARTSDGSILQDELGPLSKLAGEDFLRTADYISRHGVQLLSLNMQNAVAEMLKNKKLNDSFSKEELTGTLMQILENFMSMGEEKSWISYLLPENATSYAQQMALSGNGFDGPPPPLDIPNLEKLMSETHLVLSSQDFRYVVNHSLEKVVDALVEDVFAQAVGAPPARLPLANLVLRLVPFTKPLLEDPIVNKFIQIIRTSPQVEFFYTCLYANVPPET